MKKAAAAIAIAAVAGWLAATWYTGKRIEDDSPARLQALNDELARRLPGYGLQIAQLDYQRGFFSSRARYGVSMRGGPGVAPGTIEIDATVQHGPFPIDAVARGKLPLLALVHAEVARTDALRELFDAAGGAAPLRVDTELAYGGNALVRAAAPAMRHAGPQGSVDFSGAALHVAYTHATGAAKGTLQADALALDVAPGQSPVRRIAVQGVRMALENRLGQSGLALGDSGLTLRHLEVQTDGTQAGAAADDLAYTQKTEESGPVLSTRGDYRIGRLAIAGVDVGGGGLAVRLAGLDGAALKRLSDRYVALVQSGPDAGTPAGASARPADAGAKDPGAALRRLWDDPRTATDLHALLAAGPTLSIEPLSWRTARGESWATLSVALAEPPPGDSDAAADWRGYALRALKSAQAHVELSRPMLEELTGLAQARSQGLAPAQAAEQASRQVNGLVAMGTLTGLARLDGDRIVGDFGYADGTVTINGRQQPVQALLPAGPR